ncbi:glutathionylspermidine synthase [Moraxella caviae]|uniref:Bifunctional glutathionylspermidine synthetase/amidase n=1 Tax=Moraxella caviae TaxID=34060 RepID=A0A1T0A297_9GAMM|nr:glutathionylspermidine synthase family protein [Moraxella caviae]OOR89391.1 glutathionylspermidine synthase [Moraxella caviae]STZ09887.1 Bifunctional glutathionylspermidine synthetase/amidase [Moraxella caviae]VEW12937.1 Bifunctional glutathionylspermidine synthetase/amidase [Moraxella caviae]
MKRIAVTPRPDWQAEMEKIGFDYHSIDGNYWQEDACYVLDEAQVDELERVTEELHQMYLQAAAHVVKTGDYARLAIGDVAAGLIESSFRAQSPSLYGRFDLCYDGKSAPKLYEYNADTPTSLFEASVAQWYWLQAQGGALAGADQFNSIHERLLVEFRALAQGFGADDKLHFAAVTASTEDTITTQYLQDVAIQAGLTTRFLDVGAIGYHAPNQRFVDEQGEMIKHLFKLYPWEWLVTESFGQYIAGSGTQFIEPAYKLLLSNKAILAVLWELFPNHPNLLPAYLEPEKLAQFGADYVQKPFYSREGASITLHAQGQTEQTGGDYGKEGFVYQKAQALPVFTNNQGQVMHTLIGSWIVGHGSAGIGVREDFTAITKDTSLFVPHVLL